jgi:hypothetical protein
MDKATTYQKKEAKREEKCAMKSTNVVVMVGRVIEKVVEYITKA